MPRLRIRRRWQLAGGAVALLIVVPAAIYHTLALRAEMELSAAVAETDAADPGWRYEQLLDNQPPIPDEENSALRVLQAWSLLPRAWLPKRPGPRGRTILLGPEVGAAAPNRQLDAALAGWLQNELEKVRPAVLVARTLAEVPRGRFPRENGPYEWRPASRHGGEVLQLGKLLSLDAEWRAEQADADGGVDSTRAITNAGRALGQDPDLLAQLMRIAAARQAVAALERVLARGQASEPALAAQQALLDDELRQPWLRRLFRFQRAEFHRAAEAVERGDVRLTNSPLSDLWSKPASWLGPGLIVRTHAEVLRSDLRVVQMVAGPFEEMAQRLAELRQKQVAANRAASYLQVRFLQCADDLCMDLTHLHCAVVGIALERYRRAHGRWPEDLQALVPQHLAAVPLDPFDLKPLRYLKWTEGVVVYSLMKDGVDRVGASAKDAVGVRQNIGFRLWDTDQRRLPPRNPEVGPPAP